MFRDPIWRACYHALLWVYGCENEMKHRMKSGSLRCCPTALCGKPFFFFFFSVIKQNSLSLNRWLSKNISRQSHVRLDR
ncbi:hypothetical protein I7I48_03718 [Histoplasma ohiense]|nr:hypothetical protein I7I48_03718 [Histoplasma ohiense (nom. inval.)]